MVIQRFRASPIFAHTQEKRALLIHALASGIIAACLIVIMGFVIERTIASESANVRVNGLVLIGLTWLGTLIMIRNALSRLYKYQFITYLFAAALLVVIVVDVLGIGVADIAPFAYAVIGVTVLALIGWAWLRMMPHAKGKEQSLIKAPPKASSLKTFVSETIKPAARHKTDAERNASAWRTLIISIFLPFTVFTITTLIRDYVEVSRGTEIVLAIIPVIVIVYTLMLAELKELIGIYGSLILLLVPTLVWSLSASQEKIIILSQIYYWFTIALIIIFTLLFLAYFTPWIKKRISDDTLFLLVQICIIVTNLGNAIGISGALLGVGFSTFLDKPGGHELDHTFILALHIIAVSLFVFMGVLVKYFVARNEKTGNKNKSKHEEIQ